MENIFRSWYILRRRPFATEHYQRLFPNVASVSITTFFPNKNINTEHSKTGAEMIEALVVFLPTRPGRE